MTNEYDGMIRDALKKAQEEFGVGGADECFAIVKAIIETESTFNPNATNTESSARGLMQITKAAAKDMGYNHDDMFDPAKNIECGVKYLATQIKEFKDCWAGIGAYKAGPGAMRKAGGDIEKLPKTGPTNRDATRKYVETIKKRMKKYLGGNKMSSGDSEDKELERILLKIQILEGMSRLAGELSEEQKNKIKELINKLIEELQKELEKLSKPKEGKKEGAGTVPKEESEEYIVKEGDESVWNIAREKLKEKLGRKPKNGEIQKAVDKIKEANPGKDLDHINPGDRINIPPL